MKKLLVITAFVLFAGIAFGQTLKKGSIVSISYYEVVLQPDVTMNQYLKFLETKYNPAFEKAYPGVKRIILKGDRGDLANKIGDMLIFDSKEIRDKYWPTQDGETQWNEGAQELMQKMAEELGKFQISSTRTYTDWKIL